MTKERIFALFDKTHVLRYNYEERWQAATPAQKLNFFYITFRMSFIKFEGL